MKSLITTIAATIAVLSLAGVQAFAAAPTFEGAEGPSVPAAAPQAAPQAGADASPQIGEAYAGIDPHSLRTVPWSDELLELAAQIPLQDGGRVKPLSTFGAFRLLKFNGKRSLEVVLPDGTEERLDPTGWLLDVMFFPEQARRYQHFLIRDDATLTALGLEFSDRKRSDRYSYDELLQARSDLAARSAAASEKESASLTRLERDFLILGTNVFEFEDLAVSMEFARAPLALSSTEFLRGVFPEPRLGVTTFLEQLDVLQERWSQAEAGELDPQVAHAELAAANAIVDNFGRALDRASYSPGLIAPADDAETTPAWFDLGDVLQQSFETGNDLGALPMLAALERAEAEKQDPEAFLAALTDFKTLSQGRAEARGEFSKIPMEVSFYKTNYFVMSLAFFLLGFLAMAVTWMRPARILTIVAWGASSVGLAYLVAGIVMRCVLRSRPPVSTLYETILFITAVVVAVALFIEWATRQRIALSVGALVGAGGMFLSTRYELKEAVSSGDTMPSLVAVLDTNFWLSTHVTTVTMGYAAGLLAAVLANVWLIGRMLGIGKDNRAAYASITRMVYGVTCFGLLFAVVGTILGGVWANYSWGRFWGWDPKENGALMIVLWQLIILHARLGGYVKQFGIHVLALVGGSIVVFSWWGVNLLNVGLHTYGFTTGVGQVTMTVYIVEGVIGVAALLWYFFVGSSVANGGKAGPPAAA